MWLKQIASTTGPHTFTASQIYIKTLTVRETIDERIRVSSMPSESTTATPPPANHFIAEPINNGGLIKFNHLKISGGTHFVDNTNNQAIHISNESVQRWHLSDKKPLSLSSLTNVAMTAPSVVGRASELMDLHQLLQGGPVVVTGPPGIGKMALVELFLESYASGALFSRRFDADTPSAIINSYRDFASDAELRVEPGTDNALITRVHEFLDAHTGWIIVFRGAIPDTFTTHCIKSFPKTGSLMMTSTQPHWPISTLPMGPLTENNGYQLLYHLTQDPDEDGLRAIHHLHGGNPRALIAAGRYMKGACPAKTYRLLYTRGMIAG